MTQISVYTAVSYDQTLQTYGCQIAKFTCKLYLDVHDIIEMGTKEEEENTDQYTSPIELNPIFFIKKRKMCT